MTNPADIILQQLGGKKRLTVMIGASDFYSKDDGMTLTFRFKLCRKASHIEIHLNALDLYDIKFIKIGRRDPETHIPKVTVAGEFKDVYVEDMKRIIEEFTGLYLSLS